MLRITGIKIHGVKVYRARLFKESNNSGVVLYCQEGMKKVRVEGNEIFKHEYVGEINRGKYMLYTVWRGVVRPVYPCSKTVDKVVEFIKVSKVVPGNDILLYLMEHDKTWLEAKE